MGLAQPVTPLQPPATPTPAPPAAPAPPPVRNPSPSLLPLILLWPEELADGTRKENPTEVHAEPQALDPTLNADIQEALVRCAEKAHSAVMTRYFGKRRPTPKECNEKIGEAGLTRAQKMGNDYEEAALECVRNDILLLKRMGEHGHALILKQTYRRNPTTGNVEHFPDALVENLLRNKQYSQLRGSIVPDVVVHRQGFPNKVQAVYDFKFSCTGKREEWRTYDKGPYRDRTQGEVYEELLGVRPVIIRPPPSGATP
jgi:hypothetical protein